MSTIRPADWVAGIGSRQTPNPMLVVIRILAGDIAARGTGIRSGNALGADQAWEEGARRAGGRVVSFTAAPKPGSDVIAFEHLPAHVQAKAMAIASQHHQAWDRLGEYIKRLMARNACQVLGETLEDPVTGVLCWAEGSRFSPTGIADVKGGTGLAVRLAHSLQIPVLNLAVPAHFEHARCWHRDPSQQLKHLLDLPAPEI